MLWLKSKLRKLKYQSLWAQCATYQEALILCTQTLANAGILSKAGIKVILTVDGDTHNTHQLRFTAGNAVANGMSYDAALASVTANVAEVFNLDAGTIEVGKAADLVLWSNDPFELSTSAEKLWIAGEEQKLESRQDALRDRYMATSDMPRAYTK